MRVLLIAAGVCGVIAGVIGLIVAVTSGNDNPRRPVPRELAARQLAAEQDAARERGFGGFREHELEVRGASESYSRSVALTLRADQCLVATVVVSGFLDRPSVTLVDPDLRTEYGSPSELAHGTCGGVACTAVWCAPGRRTVWARIHAWHIDASADYRHEYEASEVNSGGTITLSIGHATRARIGGLHAAHRGQLTEAGIEGMPEWDRTEQPPPP